MAEIDIGRGGDGLLVLKRDQKTLHRELEIFLVDLVTPTHRTGINAVGYGTLCAGMDATSADGSANQPSHFVR
ncbi:hypothetical protein [Methylobacterium oryzisoli]|uniref:hypothetical protein n=1 Tax=Methylobacterium oryzisoli TaxID=3385502 RepID=UPI0038923CB7